MSKILRPASPALILPERWMHQLCQQQQGHFAFGFVGGVAGGYSASLAAITNKTLLLQADLSTANNGDTLVTSPFVNAGSAGGNFQQSSAIWQTAFQNGLTVAKTVLSAGIGDTTSRPNIGASYPDKIQTSFFVGQYGAVSGTRNIIGDATTYDPIKNSNGNIVIDSYNSSTANNVFTTSGLIISVGVPFVVATRVNSSGDARFNLNGTVANFVGAAQNTDTINAPTINYPRIGGAANTYVMEVIVSADAVSDAAMDAMVGALKLKWAIT